MKLSFKELLMKQQGIPKNGLVGYYKFDEGSGQYLLDYSVRGNHLQLGSDPGEDSNDPSWSSGLTFTSTSGDICTESSISTDFDMSTALSLGVWIKGAAQTAALVAGKFNITSKRSWCFLSGIVDNSKITAYLSEDGSTTNRKLYQSSITVFDGDWHFCMMTWNSGTLRIFIDGVEDTTPLISTDTSFTSVFAVNFCN